MKTSFEGEPQNIFDNKSIFIHVMAWCRHAKSNYLSHCWPRYMSPVQMASLGRNVLNMGSKLYWRINATIKHNAKRISIINMHICYRQIRFAFVASRALKYIYFRFHTINLLNSIMFLYQAIVVLSLSSAKSGPEIRQIFLTAISVDRFINTISLPQIL